MQHEEHIVIVGNGIAGVSLARHIRKLSDKKISIISDEAPFFFSRTALMYVYMGHMKWEHLQPYEEDFWKKNNIALKQASVVEVLPQEKKLKLADGSFFHFDKLVLATGSKPNKFGWPGENLEGVQGLYSKQDLENLERNAPDVAICHRAVIVGGGLIGIELTEMFASRNIPVTFLVREKSFWNNVLPSFSSEMLNKHILLHGIDLRLGVNLKEIKSKNGKRASSVIISETNEEIHCDVVGLTAGVSPNIDFLKSSEIETHKGVLIDEFFETNCKGIYAIGDCAERKYALGNRAPIEAVWYTGRIMGETLAQTLCGNPQHYQPGPWFNSAKFFDIEYQTYGWVFPQPKEGNAHFYWRLENQEKCIEIEYEKKSGVLKGMNTFGIRLRHEFFDVCLRNETSVEEVLRRFNEAQFDPEFTPAYQQALYSAWKMHK